MKADQQGCQGSTFVENKWKYLFMIKNYFAYYSGI